MKEPVLVVVKPDAMNKRLVGQILSTFECTDLEMVALKVKKTTKELVEEHYKQLKGESFYEDVLGYLTGKFHQIENVVAIIYYGEDAVKKCRKMAGATNPESAEFNTLRGRFGRIHTKGLMENVVHVSSDQSEAEREIKLWFSPEEISVPLFNNKCKEISVQKRVWA